MLDLTLWHRIPPTQPFRPPLTAQQSWLRLSAREEHSECCNDHDRAIAILAGQGWLTLADESITLEPGMLVFIPARQPYWLQTSSELTCLLIQGESDSLTSGSAWIVSL
jgi:uncharacterized RmlC-like cupin family protein